MERGGGCWGWEGLSGRPSRWPWAPLRGHCFSRWEGTCWCVLHWDVACRGVPSPSQWVPQFADPQQNYSKLKNIFILIYLSLLPCLRKEFPQRLFYPLTPIPPRAVRVNQHLRENRCISGFVYFKKSSFRSLTYKPPSRASLLLTTTRLWPCGTSAWRPSRHTTRTAPSWVCWTTSRTATLCWTIKSGMTSSCMQITTRTSSTVSGTWRGWSFLRPSSRWQLPWPHTAVGARAPAGSKQQDPQGEAILGLMPGRGSARSRRCHGRRKRGKGGLAGEVPFQVQRSLLSGGEQREPVRVGEELSK